MPIDPLFSALPVPSAVLDWLLKEAAGKGPEIDDVTEHALYNRIGEYRARLADADPTNDPSLKEVLDSLETEALSPVRGGHSGNRMLEHVIFWSLDATGPMPGVLSATIGGDYYGDTLLPQTVNAAYNRALLALSDAQTPEAEHARTWLRDHMEIIPRLMQGIAGDTLSAGDKTARLSNEQAIALTSQLLERTRLQPSEEANALLEVIFSQRPNRIFDLANGQGELAETARALSLEYALQQMERSTPDKTILGAVVTLIPLPDAATRTTLLERYPLAVEQIIADSGLYEYSDALWQGVSLPLEKRQSLFTAILAKPDNLEQLGGLARAGQLPDKDSLLSALSADAWLTHAILADPGLVALRESINAILGAEEPAYSLEERLNAALYAALQATPPDFALVAQTLAIAGMPWHGTALHIAGALIDLSTNPDYAESAQALLESDALQDLLVEKMRQISEQGDVNGLLHLLAQFGPHLTEDRLSALEFDQATSAAIYVMISEVASRDAALVESASQANNLADNETYRDFHAAYARDALLDAAEIMATLPIEALESASQITLDPTQSVVEMPIQQRQSK